jgi:hypothetical protein
MKTDDLIRALSSDLTVERRSLERHFALAVVPGAVAALVLFAAILGPRPDVMAAMHEPRFIFKFVITLLLAFSSALLVWRLARPGAPARLQTVALALVPVVLGLGVIAELMSMPPATWEPRMVGVNGLTCVLSIPLFALPILIAALYALRDGAPVRPGLTGIVAGLFAGAAGAAIYAAHCPDDSPLFVALWYSIAIAFVAAVGGIAGRVALRW